MEEEEKKQERRKKGVERQEGPRYVLLCVEVREGSPLILLFSKHLLSAYSVHTLCQVLLSALG